MKILVVYYSRTGTTKKVGEAIAKELSADSEAIVDLKRRSGIIGWFAAGADAYRRKLTRIRTRNKPERYDMVIIGTPVWSKNMSPAVRTYLTNYDFVGKKVGFFCTAGGENTERTLEALKKLAPKSVVVGTLGVCAKDFKSGVYEEKIASFVKSLRKSK